MFEETVIKKKATIPKIVKKIKCDNSKVWGYKQETDRQYCKKGMHF